MMEQFYLSLAGLAHAGGQWVVNGQVDMMTW